MSTSKLLLNLILATAVFFLIATYVPVFKEYLNFHSRKNPQVKIMRRSEAEGIISQDTDLYKKMLEERQILVPESEEFGIVIPKIMANAVIFPEVDMKNSQEYLPHLRQGLVHAQWSGYPDKLNTIVLFSHVKDVFYQSTHYNTKFYLINMLKEGDIISLFYNGEQYDYEVTKKEKMAPYMADYFVPQFDQELLVLQTNWPAGTNYRRLVVTAKRVK